MKTDRYADLKCPVCHRSPVWRCCQVHWACDQYRNSSRGSPPHSVRVYGDTQAEAAENWRTMMRRAKG